MIAPPTVYLDDELRPHRSMSPQALGAVLLVMLAYNLLVALFMLAIGAAPVPIFLGLDVLGVAIAFRVSSHPRTGERVLVTHDEIRILGLRAGAAQVVWTSPTAFTKVEVQRTAEGVGAVDLRLSGRSLSLARMLGPKERALFAERLTSAIKAALSERHE
jgi:uncharacterized membrane protein